MSYLLIQSDARRIPLADESVHCVITSPPYFGLRNYNVQGQIGIEPTPDEFITAMIKVFREVRRVLRKDGSAWLNLGDSYVGSWGNQSRKKERGKQRPISRPMMQQVHDGRYVDKGSNTGKCPAGLKPKDLIGIPWRVALALQADGWWLRSDIIWSKPNPMPGSFKDRPTSSHEYLFLLTKSARYFYDFEATREKAVAKNHHDLTGTGYKAPGQLPHKGNRKELHGQTYSRHRSSILGGQSLQADPDGLRNLRTVWTVPTAPCKAAHFATFPPKLIRPCIRAGTSERGCCPACGAPWKRIVDVSYENPGNRTTNGPRSVEQRHETAGFAVRLERQTKTTGWEPTCSHGLEPVPCIVFDPFIGSGTSIVVANGLGRRAIGCDLSRDYLANIARHRIERPHAPVPRAGREESHPLFDS